MKELYRAGRIELESHAAGHDGRAHACCRRRHPGVLHATSVGTLLAKGKETREFRGRQYVLEEAFFGDVALVEAWEADRWGNLTYNASARNFNPIMATAAKLTIAQAQHIVDLGVLDPERIVHARHLRQSRGARALR